ncbi:hypothetical protein diail_7198, partial [Diaporthe ilicicola]
MSGRKFPTIASLQMWTDETNDGSEAELPSNSTRYQLIEKCIHQGFQLLETSAGRSSLVETAQFILKSCEESKKHSHLFVGKHLKELPRYVDHFLACMRTNFPIVRLRRLEAEAAAIRFGGINDMNKFNPKVAGDVLINRDIINALLYCIQEKKQSHVTCFKFQLAISIAHEIIHFLYGFLTGEAASTVHTPKAVAMDGYADGTVGESGRYWEGIYLGGAVENWSTV